MHHFCRHHLVTFTIKSRLVTREIQFHIRTRLPRYATPPIPHPHPCKRCIQQRNFLSPKLVAKFVALTDNLHVILLLEWVRLLLSLKIFDYRLRLTCAISTTNRPNRSSRIDWRDLNRFRPLQGKNAQSVQIDLVSWSNPP